MLIDLIELFNFRAYQGEHAVSLSINPEKHVTIISGQNGFGKTSLLTSLVWVLYGKLMVDVDERYRKEIYESGGYGRYASKLMNRNALAIAEERRLILEKQYKQTSNVLTQKLLKTEINRLYSFGVSVKITNIFIPHLPCNDVTITRNYNTRNQREELEILIDGKVNELTKTIGQEIFINDFILPKEIAKFFFFDAEKITALAEVKSIDEKLYFSKAYNEVLGIKKYVDLKQNLENLQLRISKKSASKGDLKKIEAHEDRLLETEELLKLHYEELYQQEQDWLIKKNDLAEIQERLVRAGSGMTTEELNEYKSIRNSLYEAMAQNKLNFNELLELAPFAMLAGKMTTVLQQLSMEERSQHSSLVTQLLKDKYKIIKKAIVRFDPAVQGELDAVLREHLEPSKDAGVKILLDFSEAQTKQFRQVYETLQNSYALNFKNLVAEAKRLQSTYNLTLKKVKDAELKANDPVIKKMKARFDQLQEEVTKLENGIINLKVKIGVLEKDVATINRILSELRKHVKIEKQDQEKAETAERLINHLNIFIYQLKQKKKASLEKNIRKELNVLMHKGDFVDTIDVKIEGDLIDIDLYDRMGVLINKEGLSKGEQQLYATALLKALVSESNIQFPVFIDSPLQKLDRMHAANIIKGFYPSVSSQVVLFPLLEKELTEKEYMMLFPKVGKSYLISQGGDYSSSFADINPADVFEHFNKQSIYVQ